MVVQPLARRAGRMVYRVEKREESNGSAHLQAG